MNDKCPNCGSNKISIERSIDGHTICQDCGRKEKHNLFYHLPAKISLERISTEDLKQELKERKNKMPEILSNDKRNYIILKNTCKRVMEEYKKQGYSKHDEVFIYEEALKCFYGENIFDWINKHNTVEL